MALVPVDISATLIGVDAAAEIDKGEVDICVLDVTLPFAGRECVLEAVRNAVPPPFVVGCTPHVGPLMDGIDRMLQRPTQPDEARRLVEVCVRVKVPTRVLVVDDSTTMRSIMRKILLASHVALDMDEASEGMAALDRLRNERFEAVFLDYNMSGIDGIETLAEIKRVNPNLGVAMMTSTLDPAIAEHAQAAGALGFLKKPFYPADVDTLLERHFGLTAVRE